MKIIVTASKINVERECKSLLQDVLKSLLQDRCYKNNKIDVTTCVIDLTMHEYVPALGAAALVLQTEE